MAYWLKAAEDLFEVVDRRAKLVVGEKSNEFPGTAPGLNDEGSHGKKARSRVEKASSVEDRAVLPTEREQSIPELSQSQAIFDGKETVPSVGTPEHNTVSSTVSVDGTERQTAGKDGLTETRESKTFNEDIKQIDGHPVAAVSSDVEDTATNSNGDIRAEDSAIVSVGSSSNSPKGIEIVNGSSGIDSDQTMMNGASSGNIDVLESRNENDHGLDKSSDTNSKDMALVTELDNPLNKKQVLETVTSAAKEEDQLDEAQGLLKTAVSTGQSKEARLARVCAGLSSRLQEYKSENSQLEELLMENRELSKSYEAQMKQLQKDLSASKGEVGRVESNMVEALAAKNAEIESLINSVEALRKQSALADEKSLSLQASMESIMRNRELTETRMLQALREELAAAERRAEEEHSVHTAIKLAAREREVELEQKAIQASTALVSIQRTADERTAKAAELEQKVALLEVECASLNQELQDMEARVRRVQKKSPEDSNQAIQVQAWQEEIERARQGQRDAENKLSATEAEIQKMRVEMAAMKRDAEHYSRQEHMELEKRYRELTDLLYYKQTQLENMASEKAAAEFQLEKEVKRLHEAQLEAERSRTSRRASSSWEEDSDIKALEPLPLYHRHIAGATLQLQKAAKLLDSGAVRATRFLWRYPTARVILLFYLVFVHLFLMYLLHRLQEQADTFSSKEVAASMGLLNKTIP